MATATTQLPSHPSSHFGYGSLNGGIQFTDEPSSYYGNTTSNFDPRLPGLLLDQFPTQEASKVSNPRFSNTFQAPSENNPKPKPKPFVPPSTASYVPQQRFHQPETSHTNSEPALPSYPQGEQRESTQGAHSSKDPARNPAATGTTAGINTQGFSPILPFTKSDIERATATFKSFLWAATDQGFPNPDQVQKLQTELNDDMFKSRLGQLVILPHGNDNYLSVLRKDLHSSNKSLKTVQRQLEDSRNETAKSTEARKELESRIEELSRQLAKEHIDKTDMMRTIRHMMLEIDQLGEELESHRSDRIKDLASKLASGKTLPRISLRNFLMSFYTDDDE